MKKERAFIQQALNHCDALVFFLSLNSIETFDIWWSLFGNFVQNTHSHSPHMINQYTLIKFWKKATPTATKIDEIRYAWGTIFMPFNHTNKFASDNPINIHQYPHNLINGERERQAKDTNEIWVLISCLCFSLFVFFRNWWNKNTRDLEMDWISFHLISFHWWKWSWVSEKLSAGRAKKQRTFMLVFDELLISRIFWFHLVWS